MKTWLRLTLVTMTIGGGFTGIALILQTMTTQRNLSAATYVLILAFLALFAFVTISGLIFVHNPQRTTPLMVALALQIPWVSSPIITYKFAAGFQISAALIGGQINAAIRVGSDFQIYFLQRLPWGAGINLFAVAMLVLLVRATSMPNPQSQPAADPLSVSAPPDNAAPPLPATPPATPLALDDSRETR